MTNLPFDQNRLGLTIRGGLCQFPRPDGAYSASIIHASNPDSVYTGTLTAHEMVCVIFVCLFDIKPCNDRYVFFSSQCIQCIYL
jgi:hypothetical protein